MIYLPVQFYALCPVLSGVILSFNTKCLIMPRATLLKDSRLSNTINGTTHLDDAKINILLLADDLTIFALAREDLQKRISRL